MAPDFPTSRATLDTGVLRDVLALVLLLAGLVGLSWAAFATDWRLGLATVSAAAVAVGTYLANGA